MKDAPASFTARRLPGLPALGWCATVQRGARKPEVVLGDLVETSPDTFFEGVWDAPYRDHGFLESLTVMGSGGRVEDGVARFCSPTHTLDNLYCLRTTDAVLVANSLPLLLACARDAPDPRYRHYRSDIAALWRGGVPASPCVLPTARHQSVLVYAATDLVVGNDLSVDPVVKAQPPIPDDYAAYHQLLAGTVDRIVDNGVDALRRTPLHPVTTLSSGYDTTVCAVLGAPAGVTDAVTLHHDRFDDGGEEVAAALGLRVELIERDAWKQAEAPIEIDFMASNGGPVAITLAAIEGRWRAPMVLLGSLGDQVLDLGQRLMGDAQSIPDGMSLSPYGLHDFRLRAGMTFVHVPAIGAVHAAAIDRISRSEEMQPWRIGGGYDRPVPRRIVEDAGIPRSAFAVRKRASSTVSHNQALRPPARTDFNEYWRSLLRSLPLTTRWRYRWDANVVTPIARATRITLFRLQWGRFRWRATRRNLGRWYYFRSLPSAYQFHWAVQRLTDQFAAGLDGEHTNGD